MLGTTVTKHKYIHYSYVSKFHLCFFSDSSGQLAALGFAHLCQVLMSNLTVRMP